jgi:TonB family protein
MRKRNSHAGSIWLHAAAFLLAGSVVVDGAGAQRPAPEGRWVVNWAEQRCTLSRRGATEDAPAIGVTSALGAQAAQLIFLNPGIDTSAVPHGTRVDIVLLPQGDRIAGNVNRHYRAVGEHSLMIDRLEADFVDRFARSEAVALERNGRRLVELSYPIAGQAVEALRVCNDDLFESWGIDMTARRALSRLPRSDNPGSWVNDHDYPQSALRAGEQGSVVVRLHVEPDGRVSECVPVSSSGSEALDRQTCHIHVRRGRFEPALDASGQPVAASIASMVTWRIH